MNQNTVCSNCACSCDLLYALLGSFCSPYIVYHFPCIRSTMFTNDSQKQNLTTQMFAYFLLLLKQGQSRQGPISLLYCNTTLQYNQQSAVSRHTRIESGWIFLKTLRMKRSGTGVMLDLSQLTNVPSSPPETCPPVPSIGKLS